jgi:molecular chaperone DnaK (HSP70)
MTPLIPRNPTLPTKKTHVITTFWDKRSTVTIKVFQGNRRVTKHCWLLGQLNLTGIPTARLGSSLLTYAYVRLNLRCHSVSHYPDIMSCVAILS